MTISDDIIMAKASAAACRRLILLFLEAGSSVAMHCIESIGWKLPKGENAFSSGRVTAIC